MHTFLWDQQPKETQKAYERFRLYRDMGVGRSLRKLAKDLELDPSSVAEMSGRHNWQERVKAFDAYIDKASQHNQIIQTKAMKRRQIALALRAQKVAAKILTKMLRKIEKEDFDKMRPSELSKLLDVGCRLERLNRDVPEQNIEVVQQQNYDNLSLEELETYRKLQIKAQGGQ